MNIWKSKDVLSCVCFFLLSVVVFFLVLILIFSFVFGLYRRTRSNVDRKFFICLLIRIFVCVCVPCMLFERKKKEIERRKKFDSIWTNEFAFCLSMSSSDELGHLDLNKRKSFHMIGDSSYVSVRL